MRNTGQVLNDNGEFLKEVRRTVGEITSQLPDSVDSIERRAERLRNRIREALDRRMNSEHGEQE